MMREDEFNAKGLRDQHRQILEKEIHLSPIWELLHESPRFNSLLKKVGLNNF